MNVSRALWRCGALVALCATAGCREIEGPEVDRPEQACLDLARVLGERAEACGADRAATEKATIDSAAGGDCANIVQIRDEASYYADCLPFLQQLTCSQLNDPTLMLPAACEKQLLREP